MGDISKVISKSIMENILPIQIFVISLERSVDRRKRVEEQLNKTNIQWNFLDAVDGYALPQMPSSYQKLKVKRLQGYELTPGEIGCFLSHIKAWELCLKNNMTTLVFEDDFLVGENLEVVIEDLLSIADHWSLVRLSGIYETKHQILINRPSYGLVKNLGEPCGTAAYMIQPAAAKILLQSAADIYEPVDHFLEHYSKHGLHCLAAKPYPIGLAHTKSTITDRPGRLPVKGLRKTIRSIYRFIDRQISPSPWFPKT
ncbi:glycosyltransferase family 25 protein [Polynucleobacter sp. JS-Mosq-20-D10]|uniref:glycosyltransferase family 25 protein n=1 Tax=Polynucleobacter sp. JS-Mosq-20-D10 TaxID=2576922 RepID=UPI001BFD306E|nr:glycosyltransferase family 25 protein [Polynucleobacter sp. JS-Mosq-20-D10]QWE00710.1 glycosyltransferase family 25 protein [Polynucleobacter sp. JS-Mosq-20-D10]